MKANYYLLLIGMVIFSYSCKKSSDVVCKKTVSGVKTKVTVSETEYQTCTPGFCATTSLGPSTQAEYVASLEASGFKCSN